MKTKAKPLPSPKKRADKRHLWRFPTDLPGMPAHTAWSKVKKAKKAVILVLTADHVRASMKKRGNSQQCAMSTCARSQIQAFKDHHDFAGYIDWTYSGCWVATKLDANGRPSECVHYTHRERNNVAKLFDAEGPQALLAELVATGPRVIQLNPPRSYRGQPPVGPRVRGKNDGSKSPKPQFRGSKLREVIALTAGGV